MTLVLISIFFFFLVLAFIVATLQEIRGEQGAEQETRNV
jgi:hypothetical protein